MLHFWSGVYNNLFGSPEYNVLIVGREHAGKSTLMEQLKFLYTPSIQQREAEAMIHAKSRPQQVTSFITPNGNGGVTSTDATDAFLTSSSLEQEELPGESSLVPGLPLPATPEYLAQKRIRPTVGLNYAVVHHRFSPPVSAMPRVRKSQQSQKSIPSLPSPPEDVLAEQRARHKALMDRLPSDALTRVVLRDLGGQLALRSLWGRYYPLSQGLVYVVDSTLPSRALPMSTSPSAPAAVRSPPDHFTRQELEEVYREDRELLLQLLQHPRLQEVPVLLLSNKADDVSHIPLASLQEALWLADIAADPTFYMLQDSSESPSVSSSADTSVSLSTEVLLHHYPGSDEAQRRVGASGFGKISMRVVEVSALNGMGVAGAMDWLVAQLQHRARHVDNDV